MFRINMNNEIKHLKNYEIVKNLIKQYKKFGSLT